eukprot:TRINITY_DN1736_c0_g1_i2.p1 TRINITY_DN1736_c0_g1~~TRINITY_DN1736_c0_g1_i2.p1  ORF type:complete len:365 (+),score=64.91 TRINITY_DN1736_c0_g1_i2:131-1096(+)
MSLGPLSASQVVVLLAFILEVGSGMLFLFVSLRRIASSNSSVNLVLARTKSQETAKLQVNLMACVNIISGFLCYLKFCISVTTGGGSAWVDYLQWLVCTPPIIVVLCLTCSIDLETTFVLATLDAAMIMCAYFGHIYAAPELKWSWFCFGCLLFVIMFALLFAQKRLMYIKYTSQKTIQGSPALGNQSRINTYLEAVQFEFKLSNRLIWLTILSWTMYPLVWILEQSEVLTGANADIIHAVLAAIAKIMFGVVLMWYRVKTGIATDDSIPGMLLSLWKNRTTSSVHSNLNLLASESMDGRPPKITVDDTTLIKPFSLDAKE